MRDAPKILLIEDDEAFAYALTRRLERAGMSVAVCTSTRDALQTLPLNGVALAVVDHQLPDGTGVELVQQVCKHPVAGTIPYLMLTAFGSIDGAVSAMRAGCVDYMTKASTLDEITRRIQRHLALAETRRHVHSCADDDMARIDGTSPAIEDLRRQIDVVARAPDTTVLIQGETGTGKQHIGRAIHAASSRSARPYVVVDCTTLSAGILESELFGHERGAFTSAGRRKLGLVETAAGGTLLLDEIGELELSSQAKLLRLLQERRFRRVGGVDDREVDIRILAATNRDLQTRVDERCFRQDLFYRLRVFVIDVPPLRDREDDVVLLANKFMSEFAAKMGKPKPTLSEDGVAALRAHEFPGNVRELRAMIEQAVVRAPGPRLSSTELFPGSANRRKPRTSKRGRPMEPIPDEEARSIRGAMEKHFGNQSKAADELGMSRFALRRKLGKLRPGGDA